MADLLVHAERVLALQHISCEPPAAYEDELVGRGLSLARVEVDEGEPLPDWHGFAAIVVMGGPMGAYEEGAHRWLAPEKRLIREAVEADVPVWGVCLGAQLLASSLGAEVHPGPKPEVGILPVELTPAAADDPVFRHAPARFPTLQWHGDTFGLPAGATLLASSPEYPHQAFVTGRSYGIQFHLEVGPDLAREWAEVPAYAQSLEALWGPGALPRLIGELEPEAGGMTSLARVLFGRWLDDVVGLPGAERVRPAAIG
jgi:GMP synthase-like glutamine amidotransferase